MSLGVLVLLGSRYGIWVLYKEGIVGEWEIIFDKSFIGVGLPNTLVNNF